MPRARGERETLGNRGWMEKRRSMISKDFTEKMQIIENCGGAKFLSNTVYWKIPNKIIIIIIIIIILLITGKNLFYEEYIIFTNIMAHQLAITENYFKP